MNENKIVIPYQIKGIKTRSKEKGYVEVLMTPVNKLEIIDNNKDLPIKISGVGPDGVLPPEIIHQMNQMMMQSFPHMFKNEDPRKFLHIESEVDFVSRGWKYGDIVNISLEKVKDAEHVEPESNSL